MKQRESVLSLSQVQEIDTYLEREWGIVMPPDCSEAWETVTRKNVGPEKYREFCEIMEGRRNAGFADVELEKAFYTMIAKKPFGTWFHSGRRAFILDGMALIQALLAKMGPEAEVLEIGCGAGYSAGWLAKKHPGKVVGIDCNEVTVRVAKERLKKQQNLCVKLLDVTRDALGQQFDLIYSIDGIPNGTEKVDSAIAWGGNHLRAGGFLVLVGGHTLELLEKESREKIQRTLDAMALGFSLIDQVGGWLGGADGWGSEPVFVLQKETRNPLPEDAGALLAGIWKKFSDYANLAGTRQERKTMAYYLASELKK